MAKKRGLPKGITNNPNGRPKGSKNNFLMTQKLSSMKMLPMMGSLMACSWILMPLKKQINVRNLN
jgi:hypothetical protein